MIHGIYKKTINKNANRPIWSPISLLKPMIRSRILKPPMGVQHLKVPVKMLWMYDTYMSSHKLQCSGSRLSSAPVVPGSDAEIRLLQPESWQGTNCCRWLIPSHHWEKVLWLGWGWEKFSDLFRSGYRGRGRFFFLYRSNEWLAFSMASSFFQAPCLPVVR